MKKIFYSQAIGRYQTITWSDGILQFRVGHHSFNYRGNWSMSGISGRPWCVAGATYYNLTRFTPRHILCVRYVSWEHAKNGQDIK